MADYGSTTPHRKRKRRRRQDPSAVYARLMPEGLLKGNIGILSEDLYSELFFGLPDEKGSDNPEAELVRHVAISPWTPLVSKLVEDAPWTIIPVRVEKNGDGISKPLPHSTLQLPTSSVAIQFFEKAFQAVSHLKGQQSRAPIEIRVLDVIPLGLDTIYVTIDARRLKKLEESYEKFGGGFSGYQVNGFANKGKGKTSISNGISSPIVKQTAGSQELRLKDAVRKALEANGIVHSDISISLPLPAHPITHEPPPPAVIRACEPVSQGLVLPDTKIIIAKEHSKVRFSRYIPKNAVQRLTSGLADEDEDTSNEQFFSAAEEGTNSLSPSPTARADEDFSLAEGTSSELSGTEDRDLSDGSLQDFIGLSAPRLPFHSPGILSSLPAATPLDGGRQRSGIETPGSVFSSYTITGALSGESKGILFRAQGLLKKIPVEALHPKPEIEDDEEARIYVDTSQLAKLGCFSGDWVRVAASTRPKNRSFEPLDLMSFKDTNMDSEEWRAMKIYGLPGVQSSLPRYPINRRGEQCTSFSVAEYKKFEPQAFLSPISLANLKCPSHLRILPLISSSNSKGFSKITGPKQKCAIPSIPPLAKEVKLFKINTPDSTDRALENTIMRGLKRYFENKRRLVKTGDLIGINIDRSLGKALFGQSEPQETEDTGVEILSLPVDSIGQPGLGNGAPKNTSVVWYKIGHVVVGQPDIVTNEEHDDIWNGLAAIDSASITMIQAGSEQSRLPGTMLNSWEYYLEMSQLPRSSFGMSVIGGLIKARKTPHTTQMRRHLRELISAATSPRAINMALPPIAVLIQSSQRNIGKTTMATRACTDIGIHAFIIDAYDILTEGSLNGGDVKTEAFLRKRAERALACGASATTLVIRHIDALTTDRMATTLREVLADFRVLIATTTELGKIPDGVRALFTHELEMSAPDQGEREGLLQGIIESKGIRTAHDVEVSAVAVKTAALVASDLVDVVDRAVVARQERLEKLAQNASGTAADYHKVTLRDVQLSGGEASRCVTRADFDLAVDAARKNFADAIGAPRIPNVSWDDVGGLSAIKDAVMETIQLPLERPELFARGMKKRSGILFYGPPGTGKTLLAKAIATEFSLNFFSIKGPELLNMYIGESEANVRRVFTRARDAKPCVVFFDELDSVAPKRGNQGDSGGVMDRIVSQLLAELDGMSDGEEGGGGVFVIGATNRPDLLDQALLRPGRFDKMLYLGVSDTHDKQLTILEALTRKFMIHPATSLRRVVESLPFTYTGADLYALCSDAMLKAITRQTAAVDEKIKALPGGPVSTAYYFDHLAVAEDMVVMVTENDFYAARDELVGSVSIRELEHYDRVRRAFESPRAVMQHRSSVAAVQGAASPVRIRSYETLPSTPTRTNGPSSIAPRSSPRETISSKGKSPAPSAEDAEGEHYYDLPGTSDDENVGHGFSDLEDEYTIPTAHLTLMGNNANGYDKVNGSGKSGKGKASVKGYRALHGFEDAAQDDEEELYS